MAECRAELGEAPLSLVVVEVTAGNVSDVLELLADLGRTFRRARVAVVADRRLADYEWAVREAGAVHFVTSPLAAGELARLAVRHSELVPRPKRSLAAQVWDTLPWAEAATR